MKYLKITFVFLLCFFSFSLAAQESTSDINEEWIQLDQLGIINDDGTINPLGDNYQDRLKIQARQRGGHEQAGNQVSIEQHGSGNSTQWIQEGNNNTFNLKQEGQQNIHEGSLTGEENLIRVLQKGNNNNLYQDLAGDNMDIEVIQDGNNHELIQIEPNGNSPAYQIHQQGNHGMKVKIEHERY